MTPTAVILAGGIGKRFLPFRTDKTLFPFLGTPLLVHTLQMVAQSGIRSAIIATNPHNHDFLQKYQSHHPELSLTLVRQSQPLGMADALLALSPHLPKSDIVVMNAGDMVEPHLLPSLLKKAETEPVVVTGLETPSYQPLGYFLLSETSVRGIVEKPGAENMPSNLANLVFHFFARPSEFLALLEQKSRENPAGADDIYEQALSVLMTQGQVALNHYQGKWQKLKFGSHVLDMTEYFLSQLSPSISPQAVIHETATLSGNVVIEAGAQILPGACLVGPTYIGQNVTVGNHSLIRSSIIESGCTVGYGSEIVRSYLGPDCDIHHGYVGDSVLESEVHFGYGAHTANYRFDHNEVVVKFPDHTQPTTRQKLGALIASKTELGVGVGTLPGVTLGSGCTIYPHTLVHQPLADGTTLKARQTQETEHRSEAV